MIGEYGINGIRDTRPQGSLELEAIMICGWHKIMFYSQAAVLHGKWKVTINDPDTLRPVQRKNPEIWHTVELER